MLVFSEGDVGWWVEFPTNLIVYREVIVALIAAWVVNVGYESL